MKVNPNGVVLVFCFTVPLVLAFIQTSDRKELLNEKADNCATKINCNTTVQE